MSHTTCLWLECESDSIVARGLCERDYRRATRAGRLTEFEAPARTCGMCNAEFRTGKNGKHGYCSTACRLAGVELRRVEALRAERSGRSCAKCESPIGDTSRRDANFCSTKCQKAYWSTENQDRINECTSKWKRRNPGRAQDSDHRRRAAIAGTAVGEIDYSAVWDRDNGNCWICSESVDLSVSYPDPMYRSWDHVIPLSKGGSHTMGNLALSHLRCNVSKRDKIPDRLPEWAS